MLLFSNWCNFAPLMIKVAAKYFLSLCIFLLGAYNQLHAAERVDSHFAAKNLVSSGHPIPGTVHLFFKSASSNTRKQTYSVSMPLFENEEDDEASSFKKYLKNTCHPTVIFITRLPRHHFNDDIKVHPVSHCISSHSSSRYLLIEVFRI